jgi:hypothetical protein
MLGIATAAFLCRCRPRRRNGFQLAITLVVLVVSTAGAASASFQQPSSCLSDPHLNAVLELVHGGPIPQTDSCCMMDVCGLTCPQEIAPPDAGTFGRVRIPSHTRIFLQHCPCNLYSQINFRQLDGDPACRIRSDCDSPCGGHNANRNHRVFLH